MPVRIPAVPRFVLLVLGLAVARAGACRRDRRLGGQRPADRDSEGRPARSRGGHDYLDGRAGGDFLDGGIGRDLVFAGLGNDRIAVDHDAERDAVFCGRGHDLVNAEAADTVGSD